MRGVLATLVFVVALGALLLNPSTAAFFKADPDQLGRLVYGGALVLLVSSMLWRQRLRLGRVLADLLLWVGVFLGLIAVYAYRYELGALRDRVIGELFPGSTVIGSGGEVVLTRRADGNFVVDVDVDGVKLPFTFDTGATTVTLRYEDARKVGIPTQELSFNSPVSTANGNAMAASASLKTMTIGPIGVRNVPALVSREGALKENLLGMTFLDRLKSFSVRGDRLVLEGR